MARDAGRYLRVTVPSFGIQTPIRSIRYKGFFMMQPHGDGIRSQADSEKFRIRGVCYLYDLVNLTAKRTPDLLQGAMNQAAEKLPQPLGEARHCQLLTALFQLGRPRLN